MTRRNIPADGSGPAHGLIAGVIRRLHMKLSQIVSTACVIVALALTAFGTTACTTADSSGGSTSSTGGY
jgi:predicted small secreted protein